MTIHFSIQIRPGKRSVWRHFLRDASGAWHFAQLLSDTNHSQPDFQTLTAHREAHPNHWLPLSIPTPQKP